MTKPALNETSMAKILQSIRELWEGRSDAVGTVTLTANVTTTTVAAANLSAKSRIHLEPRTANAAGALATTYITAANHLQGSFVITHANTATTDRTFGWSARG